MLFETSVLGTLLVATKGETQAAGYLRKTENADKDPGPYINLVQIKNISNNPFVYIRCPWYCHQ